MRRVSAVRLSTRYLTSYTVMASPGGQTATGSASPITVGGLANGTSYSLTVAATNPAGTGPASQIQYVMLA